jgi:hypothetical protein
MIDTARKLVEAGIRRENPGLSDKNLKIKVFRRYYGHEFPAESLAEIEKFLAGDPGLNS